MVMMMAATINAFAPVTPPPENQNFTLKPMPLSTSPHAKPKAGAQVPLPSPADFTTSTTSTSTSTSTQAQTQTQTQPTTTTRPKQAAPSPSQTPMGANFPMDPGQLAMVSRIATYYQQRCLAITNFQQQRCQAWANMHRQKCQETMQAAMLVVAWYVRDRIQRRRRRQKKKFRNGLRQRHARPKITRGEVVRRWVMQVPGATLPPDSVPMDRVADKEEAGFTLDTDVPPDHDTKLFEMADGLIKSQYRRIEVPLMGVLSFDESESESESDRDTSHPDGDDDDESLEDGSGDDAGAEYEDDDDDELYDDEDLDMDDDDLDEGELVSELVNKGTTAKGSREDGGTSSL